MIKDQSSDSDYYGGVEDQFNPNHKSERRLESKQLSADVSMFNANDKKPFIMRSPQPAVNPMVQPQFFFDQKQPKREQGAKQQPQSTMAAQIKAKNKKKKEMKANQQ